MADTKISADSAATSVLALVAAGVQGGANVKFDPTLLALLMNQPLNCALAASVSGNALTISLKGNDGNDPAAGNPVYIPFRSPTAATGTQDVLTATAATSLVISSGSTMGFANSTAGRLWIVAFDDAGTLRLGAVNVRSASDVMPLRDNVIASSTAEGGSGAADSAQVIYTGTAVTSKGMRILGYMDWSSGLTTAGTWASGPTLIQMFGPGVAKPGDVIQTAVSQDGASATGTTVLPVDNTIPQNTEGVQFMSKAITPTAAPNLLEVFHQGLYTSTAAVQGAVALFRDSTAGALAAMGILMATNEMYPLAVQTIQLAGSTSSTTFKVRMGGGGAGTFRFNGFAGAQVYGGVVGSVLTIKEIMA